MEYLKDFASNEKRIAQQLIARDLSGLFELLIELKGLPLRQDYTLRWLYAVGGQSILYLAEGPHDQLAIVKMALLPYHRAAYISIEDIYKERRHIESEAHLLNRFHDTVLPKFYNLIYSSNPLHPTMRSEEVVDREPYLVMEFIQGHTLREIADTIHRSRQQRYIVLEWIAWKVANTVIDFSIMISKEGDPCLYSDFNPSNIILINEPSTPVRILDAGSLIPLHANPNKLPPFTWAYIPPEYYEAYDKAEHMWPTPGYVMYTLGKTLWQILTNRQPSPGEDPNLSEPKLKKYSHSLQDFIFNLIKRRYENFEQLKQVLTSNPVLEQQPITKITQLFDAYDKMLTKNWAPMSNVPAIQPSSPVTVTRLTRVHETQTDVVQRIRYSPDGQYIAVASGNRVELWESDTLRMVRCFKEQHLTPVVGLDFDATGKYLASGSKGILCLWRIDTNDAVWYHHNDEFNGFVALNAEGDFLAATTKGEAGVFVFHPQRTIQLVHQFNGIANQNLCIAVARRQPLLAIGGLGGVLLWDLRTKSAQGKLRVEPAMAIKQVTFSAKTLQLAALKVNIESESPNRIMVWDVPSRKILWEKEMPFAKINEIRLEANGCFAFAGSLEGHLWMWDQEHALGRVHRVDRGQISSLDFASDRQTLATATLDGEVCIYRLET